MSTATAVTAVTGPIPPEWQALDAYWRAANYLSAGQIYLMDNPLLDDPLRPEHIKPRLLGHWGTTPGLNFVSAHLNRVITARDLDIIYIFGPGHGGPAAVANAYLEGTYTETYPHIRRDREGMRRLSRQFSFPGGVGIHSRDRQPGRRGRDRVSRAMRAHIGGASMQQVVCRRSTPKLSVAS